PDWARRTSSGLITMYGVRARLKPSRGVSSGGADTGEVWTSIRSCADRPLPGGPPMPPIARIETLRLRGPAEGDVEAWAALLTDPDFRRYIPVRRSDDSAEERARRGLAKLSERWTTEPLRAMGWVISLRDGR